MKAPRVTVMMPRWRQCPKLYDMKLEQKILNLHWCKKWEMIDRDVAKKDTKSSKFKIHKINAAA